jgi:hypothetical protein
VIAPANSCVGVVGSAAFAKPHANSRVAAGVSYREGLESAKWGTNVTVSFTGAALFNPYEGDGRTVAMANNFTVKNAAGKDVVFDGYPMPGM